MACTNRCNGGLVINISVCLKRQYFSFLWHRLIFIWSFCFPPAASVLLCVRVACLRGVFAVRASSTMRRGKKTEEATSDGENDTSTSRHPTSKMALDTLFSYLLNWTPESCILFSQNSFVPLQPLQKKQKRNQKPRYCTRTLLTKWLARMDAMPTWRLRHGTWMGWGPGSKRTAWMWVLPEPEVPNYSSLRLYFSHVRYLFILVVGAGGESRCFVLARDKVRWEISPCRHYLNARVSSQVLGRVGWQRGLQWCRHALQDWTHQSHLWHWWVLPN